MGQDGVYHQKTPHKMEGEVPESPTCQSLPGSYLRLGYWHLCCFDGSFGNFKTLYRTVRQVAGLFGLMSKYEREYQDKDIVDSLENGVQFWTDYSKVHYHPQSLYELSGVWMDVEEFDNYVIGRDSFAWTSHGEEISDRLRFFVEECDHMQVSIT